MWSDLTLSTLISATEGDLRSEGYRYMYTYAYIHWKILIHSATFFPLKELSEKMFWFSPGWGAWQCLISPALKVINVITRFYHEYEWCSEGWMKPKNLCEKWGMKHFWKYISPKPVLLHILYPFQYATKGLSHQLNADRKEQTRTRIQK